MTEALLIIIIILISIPYLVDGWLYFNEWQARIHIGRWTERNAWKMALLKITKKWSNKTPTVKIKDCKRYVIFDILSGQYRHPTIQGWQDAAIILGLNAYKCSQKDNVIRRYICEHTGNWIMCPPHIDNALLAYSIMQSCTDKKKVAPAMHQTYDIILSYSYERTIAYRHHLPYVRFVDTIGLICPFLFAYSIEYQVNEAKQLALRIISEYDQAIYFGLPCHSYDIKEKKPRGIFDWGRGCGWYILGLLESYRVCREYSLHSEMNFLYARLERLAETLLPLQLDDGGFGSMLFNAQGNAESSATVLVGLLMQFIGQVTNEKRYRESTSRVISCLMNSTRRDGVIDNCQGDIKGIGYYSSNVSYMPFVQGLALVLISREKEDENT